MNPTREELKGVVEQCERELKAWKSELTKFKGDNQEIFDELKRLQGNVRIATKKYQEILVMFYEAGDKQ